MTGSARFPKTSPLAAPVAALLLSLLLAAPGATQGPTTFPPEVAPENEVYDPAIFGNLEFRMAGPFRGGRVTAVAGVRQQPHTFYMGSVGGGVWRTEDAGETWTNLTDGQIAVGSIGDLRVAPSDPNVIWVGTGSVSTRGNVSVGNGVYRSMDRGKNWTHVGLADVGQIGEIAVHPDDPDVAYVAALGHIFGPNPERGVYRTRDGGESWERVLFVSDSTGFVDLQMDPTNPRILYAAAWRAERKPWTMISGAREGGIWRSRDGGESWERLEKGLPEGATGKIGLAVSPADPDRIWALIEAKEPEGGLYRSDDGGESWRRVNRERRFRQRAWYYTYLEPDPKDPETVWAMNTGLYRSVDGGESFERVRVPHGDVHDLWIHPDHPEIMVNSNDGGANVTLNGGKSWTTQRNQPTAEFYSVVVDNAFPYRLYGPQQDNSTISIPNTGPGGIDPRQHWFSVGGCETGPIALDPDDPSVIYAGCYGGTLDRWDARTGDATNVRIYPELQVGQAPKNLKYRFQWNAPIEMSPHDPTVIYHGSQFVHRTSDGGMTWETISPDLTAPVPEHLEAAGEPITHDETGVEVYHTVFAIEESPHEAGTIWAATNDGRVHLTRNAGASWTEVTPGGMPAGATINRIEISPHRAGRVFLAAYRYRRDDFRPHVFRTDDYGRSWTRLTDGRNGIPANHPVRVVREDPERQGLLYAGTEFGLFVSFDDGRHWQSLQLDLPATPVTDLKVHRGDLVVATQGRSFWILDDLGPLRQLTPEVASEGRWLFEPGPAYRASLGGFFGGGNGPESAPRGALIRYWLEEVPEGKLTLEILDAEGRVVRAFEGKAEKKKEDTGDGEGDGDEATDEESEAADTDEPGGEEEGARASVGVEPEKGLPVKEGLSAFTWNLRSPEVDQPEDVVIWGFTGGHKMVPGRYTVRLSAADGWSQERPLEVRLDPRLDDVTRADLVAQAELAAAVLDTLNAIYDQLRRVRRVRDQVKAGLERAEQAGLDEGLGPRADSLVKRLTELEERITQTKNESNQDPLNYPPMLDADVASLYGFVAGPDARPTESARERWVDLQARWSELRAEIETAIAEDVADFAAELEDRRVPAVVPEARKER